jgi:membrane protein DedA with SNARE-associated domain
VNEILQFVLKHGYSFLFAAVFVRQIGLPVPGPLFLVASGALAAAGKLGGLTVVALTVIACVSADWIWYEAGRRGGDKALHFIHRFTRDPDSHNRRAKRVFARYGLPLLLVAKFIPGLDAVAPPLAGTSCTSPFRFLAMDALGAGLYACVYGGLGYVFSHDLNRAAAYVSQAGKLLLGLAVLGVFVYYTTRKLVQRLRGFRSSRFARITPADPTRVVDPVDMPDAILGGQQNGD